MVSWSTGYVGVKFCSDGIWLLGAIRSDYWRYCKQDRLPTDSNHRRPIPLSFFRVYFYIPLGLKTASRRPRPVTNRCMIGPRTADTAIDRALAGRRPVFTPMRRSHSTSGRCQPGRGAQVRCSHVVDDVIGQLFGCPPLRPLPPSSRPRNRWPSEAQRRPAGTRGGEGSGRTGWRCYKLICSAFTGAWLRDRRFSNPFRRCWKLHQCL